MKKICFITTVSLTLKTFVLKTAEYLHNNTDWDITFICDYDPVFAESLPDYIKYIPVKMERGISFKGITAMLEMRKIFSREKFDLIQFSTPNASLYASLAGKMAKTPIRLYCQWGMAYIGFSGIKRKLFKCVEKLVCRLATHIQPDSKSNLDFSVSEGLYTREKGTVIWNGSACGINLSKFDIAKKEDYRLKICEQLGFKEDEFVFGFVGRITRDKGINELFAAFKAIKQVNASARLMMVGDMEGDQTIDKGLLDWAKSSNDVIFTGYTNIVEQYLSAMDAYVLPSYREGFGMGVIEAEAMGVPVIVSNIPGPVDAMLEDKTGLMVEKGNATDLQNAMLRMCENRDLCIEFGKAGVIHAQTHFEQQEFLSHLLENRKNLLYK